MTAQSPTVDEPQPQIFASIHRSATYHVNDGTDNLVNLSSLGRLGGHVASAERRKDGLGGLDGIGDPGRPQRGADSPSGSKSSNAAEREESMSAIDRHRGGFCGFFRWYRTS
jgi:hypothetical protein